MSHISETQIRLDDKGAIIKMCELVDKFTFNERKKFKSYGHDNWDCDFCIGVAGASYEVGFKRQSDGSLKPLVDWWSSGGLREALGGEEMPELKRAYNVGKLALEADKQGFACAIAQLPDGNYKALLTKQKNKHKFQWMSTIKQKLAGGRVISGATGQSGFVTIPSLRTIINKLGGMLRG